MTTRRRRGADDVMRYRRATGVASSIMQPMNIRSAHARRHEVR